MTCKPAAGQGDARIPHQKGLRRFIHLGEGGGKAKRRGGINREKREGSVRRLRGGSGQGDRRSRRFSCWAAGPNRAHPFSRRIMFTLCSVASRVRDLTTRLENNSTLNSGLAGRAGSAADARARNANTRVSHGVWGFGAKYCLRICAARGAALAPPVPRFKKITRATSGASTGA